MSKVDLFENDVLTGKSQIPVGPNRKIHFSRVVLGGLPVAVLDRKGTAELTVGAALSRRGSGRPCLFFTTVNGQVVSLCASKLAVRELFDKADLISADGMSVVVASSFGPQLALPERVATSDAFHDVSRIARNVGARFYFFGGTEEVSIRAAERACEIYPGLQIVGRRHGYFGPADEDAIVDNINAATPDVLWVGLGVPYQQEFILRNSKSSDLSWCREDLRRTIRLPCRQE